MVRESPAENTAANASIFLFFFFFFFFFFFLKYKKKKKKNIFFFFFFLFFFSFCSINRIKTTTTTTSATYIRHSCISTHAFSRYALSVGRGGMLGYFTLVTQPGSRHQWEAWRHWSWTPCDIKEQKRKVIKLHWLCLYTLYALPTGRWEETWQARQPQAFLAAGRGGGGGGERKRKKTTNKKLW